MRLPEAKRIVIEDLPDELQQPMSNVALILNPFIEQVTQILNGNVGRDNLTSKIVKFNVKTDANANIVGQLDLSTGLNSSPIGLSIINFQMTDNTSQIPNITQPPMILFQPLSNSVIRITKILNLKENSKYTITIEIK